MRKFRLKNELFLGKLGEPLFLNYKLNSTGSLGYQFGSLLKTL